MKSLLARDNIYWPLASGQVLNHTLKYSLCCPNWVPPLTWPGGGYPAYLGSPLGRVPPCPDLAGGVPTWVPFCPLAGYPPVGYPPQLTWQSTPLAGHTPWLDLAGYSPQVSAPWHSGKCCQSIMGYGYPPQVSTN